MSGIVFLPGIGSLARACDAFLVRYGELGGPIRMTSGARGTPVRRACSCRHAPGETMHGLGTADFIIVTPAKAGVHVAELPGFRLPPE